MFWRLLYNSLIVPLGWLAFRIMGLIDRKARKGIRGRKNLFERLRAEGALIKSGSKIVWFHSSSLGEFEQARPIIAELKKRHPEVDVVVSFFSPSGYEHSRTYKLATLITYLPFDSYHNARRFIDLLKPAAAVMVRYDIWPNHLWALRRAGVPTFIANATLRDNSARRLPLVKQFHRAVYNVFDYILTVSEADQKVFESFALTHPVLHAIGDTRYDQVWRRSQESRTRHVLPPSVVASRRFLVAGSSWEEDEEVLLPAFFRLLKHYRELLLVLVPHEPSVENIERIEIELNGYTSSIRFSELSDFHDEKAIIIDSVGVLMTLYQYAHVAYVGGSFRQGVHNVLEPAAYGVPIVFGPKHDNSQEAIQLVKEGAAFVGANEQQLFEKLKILFGDEDHRHAAGGKAQSLVRTNVGATERFLSYLEKVL